MVFVDFRIYFFLVRWILEGAKNINPDQFDIVILQILGVLGEIIIKPGAKRVYELDRIYPGTG